jgi:hypothetical protein
VVSVVSSFVFVVSGKRVCAGKMSDEALLVYRM